jgi:DUF1365 family protein
MTPSPASLLVGQVGHTRRRPRHHSLRYRVASILADIDGPDAPASNGWTFGFNRPGLVSLHTSDHGADTLSLRAWVENRLREAGSTSPIGRIQLLAAPRIFGLSFNPVSVFFAYDQHDDLTGLVFEVSNFHGGRCAYAFPVDARKDRNTPHHLQADKRFFVSPFNPVSGHYRFKIARDDHHYRLSIQLIRDDEVVLTAAHTAQLQPLTPGALRSASWLVATNTIRIFFGILWEALRLRLKGLATFAPRRGTEDTLPGRH